MYSKLLFAMLMACIPLVSAQDIVRKGHGQNDAVEHQNWRSQTTYIDQTDVRFRATQIDRVNLDILIMDRHFVDCNAELMTINSYLGDEAKDAPTAIIQTGTGLVQVDHNLPHTFTTLAEMQQGVDTIISNIQDIQNPGALVNELTTGQIIKFTFNLKNNTSAETSFPLAGYVQASTRTYELCTEFNKSVQSKQQDTLTVSEAPAPRTVEVGTDDYGTYFVDTEVIGVYNSGIRHGTWYAVLKEKRDDKFGAQRTEVNVNCETKQTYLTNVRYFVDLEDALRVLPERETDIGVIGGGGRRGYVTPTGASLIGFMNYVCEHKNPANYGSDPYYVKPLSEELKEGTKEWWRWLKQNPLNQ